MSRYPNCYVCGEPCCCGQRDARGFPAHLGCQPSLPPEERNPRLAEWSTSFIEGTVRHGDNVAVAGPPGSGKS